MVKDDIRGGPEKYFRQVLYECRVIVMDDRTGHVVAECSAVDVDNVDAEIRLLAKQMPSCAENRRFATILATTSV